MLEGGFRPGGLHREWCDAEILRQIRRKSLARLRREVEPVEQHTLARFLTHWQGLLAPRRTGTAHLDALLDAIENLQGAPLPASLLETSILPARIADYHAGRPRYVDCRGRSGVGWSGADRRARRPHCAVSCRQIAAAGAEAAVRGTTDGTRGKTCSRCSNRRARVSSMRCIRRRAAAIRARRSMRCGAWCGAGLITNDSLHALRAYIARPESARTPRRLQTGMVFRSRRTTPPTAQGRWSMLPLGFALSTRDLKWHGFSHAGGEPSNIPALAAGGKDAASESIPQGLKPRVFCFRRHG